MRLSQPIRRCPPAASSISIECGRRFPELLSIYLTMLSVYNPSRSQIRHHNPVLRGYILESNIVRAADAFRKQRQGAKSPLKEVKNPQRFGAPTLEGNCVVKIEEKPANSRSSYAVTSVHFYDARVRWDNRISPPGQSASDAIRCAQTVRLALR